jgi:hypothetical protein
VCFRNDKDTDDSSDEKSSSKYDLTPKESKNKPLVEFGKPKKRGSGMGGFLNLKKLDDDFLIPDEQDWVREKTMGIGAYGKVMECFYKPLSISFAVKRFE